MCFIYFLKVKFWKKFFEFASFFQFSIIALPLNCFKVAIRGNLEPTFKKEMLIFNEFICFT